MSNFTLPPQKQSDFYGHQSLVQQLLAAWEHKRLPHALLLIGPKGIGKATFAFRLARFILASKNRDDPPATFAIAPNSPLFKRIASGGHGDLLVIQPDESQDGLSFKEISVEKVREVKHFLSQTPLEGGWRVVIVDGEMNRHAANALLKGLEEPPSQTLLIILSESLGRVMPTLRSRCQLIRFFPLEEAEMSLALMRGYPHMLLQDLKVIVTLAEGRLGWATRLYQGGGVALYRDLIALLNALEPFSLTEVEAFCHKYATRAKNEEGMDSFYLIGDFLQCWIQRLILNSFSPLEELVSGEGQSWQKAQIVRPILEWPLTYQKITELFQQAHGSHLDRYQVLVDLFFNLYLYVKDEPLM